MTSEKPEQPPLDDEGRPIEPGDLVIEFDADGHPILYTQPDD